jgi:hypothetical protein
MTKLSPPLNRTQLEILKLFSQPMNDKDLAELKEILIDFLMSKLIKAADSSIEKQGISTEDVDNWRFEHNRISSSVG